MTSTSTSDLQAIMSKQAQSDRDYAIEHANELVLGPIEMKGEDAPAPPPAPAEASGRPEVDFTQTVPKVVGGLPYARAYMKLALTISGTEMVPGAMRGRSDAVMAAMMMGYELGLGPMQSLDSFNVIDGKVGLTAEAMRALVLQAGHVFILSATNTEATVRCRRKDWPEGELATFTWTMEDAKRAGLGRSERSGWSKYPRAMLSARVSSEACRATFPDVLKGMSYTPEELTDMGEQAGAPEPVAAPEPPPTVVAAEQAAAPEAGPPPAVEASGNPVPPQAPAPAAAPEVTGTEKQEMVKALTAVINGLPGNQQALCRAYLSTHGYRNPSRLTMDHLQDAINIAAGWPTSVAQEDFAPGEEEAVDAEVVDGEDPALFDG